MTHITQFLTSIQQINQLHESMLKEICRTYHLTLIEAKVISFLHNNPGKDTAADIVELRNLPKGNVSQAVQSLFQKSLLVRAQDGLDRRRIHLSLTPAAEPIVQSMDALFSDLRDTIFAGISAQELSLFFQTNLRILQNTETAIERRKNHA